MIEPLFSPSLSIAIALAVLGALVFLEIKRKLKYLVPRLIAQLLLVTSILLLTLRPSIETKDDQTILLLTEGYQQKTIDSLTTQDHSLKPVAFASVNELSKLNGVSVITGDGLPLWAIDLLPAKNYSFISSAHPQGITSIETDDHIYAHRWNHVRGTYAGEAALLKLRGPGGIDDSVKVTNGAFSLSFFAKAPGRFSYELVTPRGNETLPLVIEPEQTFNIVFVSNYPTFENRYLKNFLASKGHRLSIRNQVSRGLYKFEFANRPSDNFQSLTPALLNETDLVVIDERSWHSLSGGEQKNVQAAINNGLGVIVLPDAKPEKRSPYLLQFSTTQEKDTSRVSLGRVGSLGLPTLQLETKQSTAILTAANNRVVSGYVHSGSGKVGYQLLNETYPVGLQGKAEAYSALWVPLLEKTARTIKQDFKLRITSPFPHYEDEPISFDIISSGNEPALSIDNIQFPLTEDVYVDDLWHGTVWLSGNTWHDFVIDSITTPVHVAKEGTWKSVRSNNNRKATALHSGSSADTEYVATARDYGKIKTILFSIFVLAAGFLWLSPKL